MSFSITKFICSRLPLHFMSMYSPSPPVTVPSAPSNVVATYSASQDVIEASWSAPSSDGGSPIQGYSVTCMSTGGAAVPTQYFPGASTTSTAPTGLQGPFVANVPYSCTVAAVNAVGTSLPSPPSPEFVVLHVPGAPTNAAFYSSCADGTTGYVTWVAPLTDGGSPVTEYEGNLSSLNLYQSTTFSLPMTTILSCFPLYIP